MELQVWKEKQDEKEPVRLRLVESTDFEGGIVLIAVNEKGEKVAEGNLITLKKNGRLYLHEGINTRLGLDLDRQGRIKLEE